MGRKKGKDESTADVYARIRKPVPPPPRVEEGQRRRKLEEIERREAETEAEDPTPRRTK